MNRDRLEGSVSLLGRIELITQAAFHEAGHAAAIYLRNRCFNLPQVSFQISLTGAKPIKLLDNKMMLVGNMACHAQLEGGLLAENQALSVRPYASSQAILVYQDACEADMVNLLAGPLAEAKHVALRDGECINPHLVDYKALKNYGGTSDLEKIEEYLDGFQLSAAQKAEKLKDLYSASFDFINRADHWRAISDLANYMLMSEKERISYEEAADILESAICKQSIGIVMDKASTRAIGRLYGQQSVTHIEKMFA